MIICFLRNISRVGLTTALAILAKLVQNPQDMPETLLLPDHTDLTQADSMPLVCEILSVSDQVLMTLLMFYLAALSLYLFCRQPNPPVLASSLKTLKVIILSRDQWDQLNITVSRPRTRFHFLHLRFKTETGDFIFQLVEIEIPSRPPILILLRPRFLWDQKKYACRDWDKMEDD